MNLNREVRLSEQELITLIPMLKADITAFKDNESKLKEVGLIKEIKEVFKTTYNMDIKVEVYKDYFEGIYINVLDIRILEAYIVSKGLLDVSEVLKRARH